MDNLRETAKQLLEVLESIKSGDLDIKIRLQEKMKKIINLSDAIIFSEDLKDQSIKLQCYKDIGNVYSFFLKSPDVKDIGKYFLE